MNVNIENKNRYSQAIKYYTTKCNNEKIKIEDIQFLYRIFKKDNK